MEEETSEDIEATEKIDSDFHVGYRLKMRYIMIYHDIPQN